MREYWDDEYPDVPPMADYQRLRDRVGGADSTFYRSRLLLAALALTSGTFGACALLALTTQGWLVFGYAAVGLGLLVVVLLAAMAVEALLPVRPRPRTDPAPEA